MPRYKTETRTGLVALYDIRPGNGAGPFPEPTRGHISDRSTSLGGLCLQNDIENILSRGDDTHQSIHAAFIDSRYVTKKNDSTTAT